MSHIPVDSFHAIYSSCCLWCIVVTLGPGYSERNMIRPLFLRSFSSKIMCNSEEEEEEEEDKEKAHGPAAGEEGPECCSDSSLSEFSWENSELWSSMDFL